LARVTVKLHGQLAWQGSQRREEVGVEVPEGATVAAVIEQLDVPAAEVGFCIVQGRRCPPDHQLHDGDILELIPVIAGG